MNKKFEIVAANENHPNYELLKARLETIYEHGDDMRSPFARDYTRLLHSGAYRRLKHKTQVFYNIDNDHICTRMEHVAHVESVSYTIAKNLGLNEELTRAVAIGHDLGHSPFGHQGEDVLSKLTNEHLGVSFWHEQNGLRFVDKIELLEDPYNKKKNLNLTYAVRDGIISHCGEVDENKLMPRKELIDLEKFRNKGQYMPATWEGCVVKVSDKIAYLGRDIEDAMMLGFVGEEAKKILLNMARANNSKVLNTTVIINNMITDICENSSPDTGICFSRDFLNQINELKRFNYKYIYSNPRFGAYLRYSELVITEIFRILFDKYEDGIDWKNLELGVKYNPILFETFIGFLKAYCEVDSLPEKYQAQVLEEYANIKPYKDINEKETYIRAIIDFIAGMTDRFAIKVFNEMLEYA